MNDDDILLIGLGALLLYMNNPSKFISAAETGAEGGLLTSGAIGASQEGAGINAADITNYSIPTDSELTLSSIEDWFTNTENTIATWWSGAESTILTGVLL